MRDDYQLAYGPHARPEEGRCAMEWVSFLAGEGHSDSPVCVSTVLRAFCTTLNDSLDEAPRQRLRPYLARTIGTAEDGLDGARSWLAVDWLARAFAPAWLAAARLDAAAARLAELPPLVDAPSLRHAATQLDDVRADTRQRWTAARGAGRAPAWSAPWAAGRAAAREAAWSSAGAAAWAAARLGLMDRAGDRARAAAREIAGDAAAIVAHPTRAAASRAAAREAARAALAPTLELLAESALELLDRMLPMVTVTLPRETATTARTV